MRTSLLVVVRWQGDVIATHTVEQGGKVQPFDFLDGCASQDVGVEVYDVTPERTELNKVAPKRDLRAAYGLVASGALHLGLAAVAVLTLVVARHPQQLEADDANRQGAMVAADTSQTAADEGADAGVTEPQKVEQQAAQPPPVLPIDDEAENDEAPSESTEPPGPVAPAEAANDESQTGSESPGSGGFDAKTATHATCTKLRAPKNSGPICHRNVVVTELDVPSGCFVDTVMQIGQTGTLSFPCSGDGEASLSFGKKSFKGATFGGKMEMCAGTEYPFSDGCRWTSAQRITGRLAAQSLSFNYGEAPKVGTTKSCASACSASGTVRVK